MIRKVNHRFFSGEKAIILYLVLIKIFIHLVNPEYGYHRDELFYIAISDNFSFHNLDIHPLTPLYLKLITSLLGYSLKAIHFASALCGALVIVFTCLITKKFGGKNTQYSLQVYARCFRAF